LYFDQPWAQVKRQLQRLCEIHPKERFYRCLFHGVIRLTARVRVVPEAEKAQRRITVEEKLCSEGPPAIPAKSSRVPQVNSPRDMLCEAKRG
jgi:hypothetical protein